MAQGLASGLNGANNSNAATMQQQTGGAALDAEAPEARLEKLKGLLVLNWRQKVSARSQLKLVIEDTLDSGLPRAYSPELYQAKCAALFEHMYEKYPERGASTYS